MANPNETPPVNTPTVSAPSYNPALASATTYNPTPYKVEPAGLVQDRIKGIIADDSPLIQQAARIDAQKVNDRGLLSSSIGIGSGREAVIGQAMPIAKADADSINAAMTNTANQQNAASQYNANVQNNVALSNQAQINDALKSTQQGTIQLTNAQMTIDAQKALAALDNQTKIKLSAMDARSKSLLQTNQSASNAYVQTIQTINAIQNNNTLNEASKRTAIDNQLALLKQQLTVLSELDANVGQATSVPLEVRNLNLGSYFDATFSSPSKTPTPAAGSPAGSAPAATPNPATNGVGGRIQPFVPPPSGGGNSVPMTGGRVF